MKDSLRLSEDQDAEFVSIVEEITARLLAGEQISPQALADDYPQYAAELANMMATMSALADWGDSVGPAGSAVPQDSIADTVVEHHRPLGDFRLIREIARGGMGIVYEAEQLSLARRVALKVLPLAAMLDEKRRKRFQNEARAAAMLRHPHIVGVHSVGCEQGVHFYAMDFIDGQSLAETIHRLRERDSSADDGSQQPRNASDTEAIAALSTERSADRRSFCRSVARLGIQAAEALHFAHQEGVIHRDIKPSNLLLDNHGKLHVTDFGLAMSLSGDGLTMTGDLLGTFRYMSPEQAAGKPTSVDHRTDVYSLGATLYELLALRPAFEGTDRQLLLRHIDEREPPALRTIDAAIPKDIETIVIKAMAKNQHERYASAADLAADLQRFLDLKPIEARRSTRIQKLSRWAKRNPALSITACLAVLLLLVLAIGGPIFAIRYAQVARDERDLRASETELSNELRHHLYDSQMTVAHAALERAEFQRVDSILRPYLPAPGQKDMRGFEWFYMWRSCQAVVQTPAVETDASVGHVAYSADGDYVALAVREDPLVIDANSGQAMWTHRWMHPNNRRPEQATESDVAHRQDIEDLAFSPDGKVLATVSYDRFLRIWNTKTGDHLDSGYFPEGRSETPVSAVAFSPDEHFLVAGHARPLLPIHESIDTTLISVWPFETKEVDGDISVTLGPEIQLPGPVGGVRSLSFSSSSHILAAACFDGLIRTWEMRSWQPLRTFGGDAGSVHDVAFSPTMPHLLASVSGDINKPTHSGRFVLWNVENGHRILDVPGPLLKCVAFSAGGQTLATGSHDGIIKLWDVASQQVVRTVRGHSAAINDLSFRPDSKTLVSGTNERTARFWNLEENIEPSEVRGHQWRIPKLAVSNDGRLLASSSLDGTGGLWEVQTGKRLETFRRPKDSAANQLWGLDISPDGKTVAVGGGRWREPDIPLGLWLWNTDSESSRTLFSGLTGVDEATLIAAVAFSPKGDRVAAPIGNVIHIYNVQNGQLVDQLEGHTDNVHGVAWSRAVDLIASMTWGSTRELKLCAWFKWRARCRSERAG